MPQGVFFFVLNTLVTKEKEPLAEAEGLWIPDHMVKLDSAAPLEIRNVLKQFLSKGNEHFPIATKDLIATGMSGAHSKIFSCMHRLLSGSILIGAYWGSFSSHFAIPKEGSPARASLDCGSLSFLTYPF